MNYCKYKNVIIRNIENPNINFIVFHHRYEELIDGCLRVATKYRLDNSNSDIITLGMKRISISRFQIEQDGTILLDEKGNKVVI